MGAHKVGLLQVIAGLVLGLGARLPQILLNVKQGHTGTLAPATFAFNAVSNVVNGTVALLLTGDIYVIATQVWMLGLNATVLSQILASDQRQKDAAERAAVSRGSAVVWRSELQVDWSMRPGYA
jgi:ABC-type branched-subunit amino acid transport system permease subunit